MSFSHNELCLIEQVAERAFRALKPFADGSDRTAFVNASYILAEVRNAGLFLCNPETTPEERQETLNRLGDLFRTE